jgi:hypothetical protein
MRKYDEERKLNNKSRKVFATKVVDYPIEYIKHPLADTDYRYKNALIERRKDKIKGFQTL